MFELFPEWFYSLTLYLQLGEVLKHRFWDLWWTFLFINGCYCRLQEKQLVEISNIFFLILMVSISWGKSMLQIVTFMVSNKTVISLDKYESWMYNFSLYRYSAETTQLISWIFHIVLSYLESLESSLNHVGFIPSAIFKPPIANDPCWSNQLTGKVGLYN